MSRPASGSSPKPSRSAQEGDSVWVCELMEHLVHQPAAERTQDVMRNIATVSDAMRWSGSSDTVPRETPSGTPTCASPGTRSPTSPVGSDQRTARWCPDRMSESAAFGRARGHVHPTHRTRPVHRVRRRCLRWAGGEQGIGGDQAGCAVRARRRSRARAAVRIRASLVTLRRCSHGTGRSCLPVSVGPRGVPAAARRLGRALPGRPASLSVMDNPDQWYHDEELVAIVFLDVAPIEPAWGASISVLCGAGSTRLV